MALCLEQLNNNRASLQQLSDQLHSTEQAIAAIDLDALTSDVIKASDIVTSATQTHADKKAAMAGIEQIVITHGDHVPASITAVVRDLRRAIIGAEAAVHGAQRSHHLSEQTLADAKKDKETKAETVVRVNETIETTEEVIAKGEWDYQTYQVISRVNAMGFAGLRGLPRSELDTVFEILNRDGRDV